MKVSFDVNFPEEYEFYRFGQVQHKEYYIDMGQLKLWDFQADSIGTYLIFKKKFVFPDWVASGSVLEYKEIGWFITLPDKTVASISYINRFVSEPLIPPTDTSKVYIK